MTRGRSILLTVVLVLVAFGAGFLWQYLRANDLQDQLDATRHALALENLEATLGAATIAAQQASFEVARQRASDFYTGLQVLFSGQEAVPAPAELQELLQRRDATITLLSRADPRAAEELTSQYSRFSAAVGGPNQALPSGGPARTGAAGQGAGTAPAGQTPAGAASTGPAGAVPSAAPGSVAAPPTDLGLPPDTSGTLPR